MAEPERRRRRVRSGHAPTPEPAADPAPPPAVVAEPARPPRPAEEPSERGLRGLVGSGSSQVSLGAALRARDAARPGDEHLAEAEKLPIVRRNWTPREDLHRR